MVDTLFSLPEISLYCQLIHANDSLPAGAFRPPYERLWRDLREAMDELHRDGTLKARIIQDLERYIVRDPALAETLHRFRSSGKRLFIMTNSHAPYTRKVMSFLLDAAYPGYQRWEDYFDFTVTAARKPVFFNCDEPFFEVAADGSLATEPATALKRGRLYHGGNFQDLTRLVGMIGDEVLYVGDHIYGDILRSKRDTSWRTAMIIPEMDRELEQVQRHAPALDRLGELEEVRFQLNLERTARALDGDRARALGEDARALNREIAQLEQEIADAFSPYWGMLFRDRAELSAFGTQVEDYACVYTSRVSNFGLYSPVWYFRSPRDRMAHELQR
jgi:FMN phosphatase YigB (HAD superfamily)